MEKERDINKKIELEARIKKEYNRLKRILRKLEIDKDKLISIDGLLKNAAFMAISLDDLKEKLIEKGFTSKYKNGENQWGTKKSPAAEMYNSMIKNYMIISKQILEAFPKEIKNIDDGFDDLIDNRGK